MSAAVEAAANEPFLTFMQKQVFDPLGMGDTRADSATEADPGSGDALLPEVRGGSPLRPGPDAPDRLFLLRGIQRIHLHSVRPGALRDGDQQRQAAATCHGAIAPDVTATALGQETGYGLGWDLETVTLAGKQTRVVGHDGDSLGGMVASLMTFPEHGIVVALTSNTSYADTLALGVKIAEAFVEEGKAPAGK